MSIDQQLSDIIDASKKSSDPRELKQTIFKYLETIPPEKENLDSYSQCLKLLNEIPNAGERSFSFLNYINLISEADSHIPLVTEAVKMSLSAVESIDGLKHKIASVQRLSENIPDRPQLNKIFGQIMESAIDLSDKNTDVVERRVALSSISTKLQERDGFDALALHAMRVCLGLSIDESYQKYTLLAISKDLPKMCDYEFYRQRTFLGITLALPKRGEFLKLYKEAINLAVDSSDLIEEPFYKKYALFFIAEELPHTEEYLPLHKKIFRESLKATIAIVDPLARQKAFIDIIKKIPKSSEFSSLLIETIENILPFFTFKSRISDLKVMDIIDYVIVVEEKKLKSSKKKMFSREKLAIQFSEELGKITEEINDIRLLEILKPYSHVWIRPKVLRDRVRTVINHLNQLMKEHHGREVRRPVFVKEAFFDVASESTSPLEATAKVDTLAIDLGATNTIIMRQSGSKEAEFIHPKDISKRYNEYSTVPTVINAKSGDIGMKAYDHLNSQNLKKMLLENSPGGSELMSKYLSSLHQHLCKEDGPNNSISSFSGREGERLCITVPVGYGDYSQEIRNMIEEIGAASNLDIVEEPLAAAIGYNVAEKKDKLVMVFDFGGCTLDIMVLRLNVERVHVVAKPDRSKMLGGRDVDLWFAQYLAKIVGLPEENMSSKLLEKAEEIKISLSEKSSVPFDWEGNNICDISRDSFEDILASHGFYDTVDRATDYVLRKAKKVGIEKEMIEEVLLTGGASLIPSFKDKITHTFSHLATKNAIYDHSPITAVVQGATIYGTKDVIDRHLGMAYALRCNIEDKGKKTAYEVIFEKGASLPFEKTFSIKPARSLGVQSEIFIELFEVPEAMIARRWVKESGRELIRQYIGRSDKEEVELKALKIVTLSYKESLEEAVDITFCIDENRKLSIKSEQEDINIDTEISLQ